MRRTFGLPVAAFVLLLAASTVAEACYCGAPRLRRCRRTACCVVEPACCAPSTCVVMMTCHETVYDEVERTAYKTVYEEVVDKVTVNGVKYVEEKAYRCTPCTVMKPCQPPSCGPVNTCGPTSCAPDSCCQMKPVEELRKCAYTTFRTEPVQKTEDRPRVVTKQIPYTYIACVPRIVTKQVPVTVCCPTPPCCGNASNCSGR
jgi:hypothetical protein